MALICCPLMVHDVERSLGEAAMAREMGADLVEYRVDELFSGGGGGDGSASLEDEIAAVVRLVGRSPVACIVTCRPTWEGGAYDGPEDARVSLFEALGTLEPPRGHPPRYIDVELAAFEKSANVREKVHLAVDHPERGRSLSPSLILSIHDFEGRPADLSRRVLAAQRQEACRVVKVAFRARSLRDNLELFDVLAARERPTIALGMGEFGLMSRVLAGKFGGFLTFASLRKAEVTAPGQPTIRELLETYRFRSIGAGTRVYGIVGWPVGQSMSPAIHNAGFGTVGHDGVYVPLPIAAGEDREASYVSFKATMRSLMEHEGLGFSGCSVTLPHKESLARLAGEMAGRGGVRVDDEVRLCGAGNTLVREEAGAGGAGWRVMNTDASAARGCLEGAPGSLEGKRIVVLGAGGVGRTIAA
ncbi:MAG: type I 3-dehydroquinate dehydratase, partial [Phycisphaerales bacterium]|nr:type I 3-dehydroquinate dehydratase [Phycisphaerales bacterium]